MNTINLAPLLVRWLKVVALLTLTCGSSVKAQTVSLNSDYVGYAGWHVIYWPRSVFWAGGESLVAPSGLTLAGVVSEGYVDLFGDLGYYQNDDLGRLEFEAPNGDGMVASIQGQGTIYRYNGSFTVTGGTGRFAGATGGGTFQIEAGTYSYDFIAPATLSIHGTVDLAPIPEPGSMALLAFGAIPGAVLLRRKRP